jgi:hypothetical protein
MLVCVHIYIYIYIHTYTHTHIYKMSMCVDGIWGMTATMIFPSFDSSQIPTYTEQLISKIKT